MNLLCPKLQNGGRRIEWLIFTTILMAFAYFHQGGQWNQNGRFAMVRAMVEKGRFDIDLFSVYRPSTLRPDTELTRIPVQNGEFEYDGKTFVLCWALPPDWKLVPVNAQPLLGKIPLDINLHCVSGDVAYYKGHFHPNKAPSTSFFAVPAYFVIYHLEKIFGANPDDWWTLTLNLWLTSVFSIGLISALGGLIFYRLALMWSGKTLASLLATYGFAFGTLFFPYATMLYEHNIAAVGLLAAFYFLYRVKTVALTSAAETDGQDNSRSWLYLSGLCVGCAAITNYIVVTAVFILTVYLICCVRKKRGWLWFGLGLLGPFLLIVVYNLVCFGKPFTTNYSHQNPLFGGGDLASFGGFGWPQWDVLLALLFSPFRGIFFDSPLLLMGVLGLAFLFREPRLRAEAWVCAFIIGVFLLINSSYSGWHGGFTTGPRYLIPALPFLALPTVLGFVRFLKTTCVLAVFSVAVAFMVTAVDPQSPVGVHPNVRVEGKPLWQYDSLTEYILPLFFKGDATPLQQNEVERLVAMNEVAWIHQGKSSEEIARLRSMAREVLRQEIWNQPLKFPISSAVGPVSANQLGAYETFNFSHYPPRSREAQWNSFNIGEFIFPQSRWSLVPLLVVWGALIVWAIRKARKLQKAEPRGSASETSAGTNPF
jgi:hypothetical protein